MVSYPQPHDKVVSSREGDVRRSPSDPVSRLLSVVKNFLQVLPFYHVIARRLIVPVGFEVTHALFLILLREVSDVRSVSRYKLDIFRHIRPYECHRFYEHVELRISQLRVAVLPQLVDDVATLLVDLFSRVSPIDRVGRVAVHEAVTNYAVSFRDDISLIVNPPVDKLAHPRLGVRVTGYPEAVSDMRSVTVVCEQIFEFLVRTLRALVDADIGKLSSLEARFEVLIRPGIVREFEPSPVGKIPCHVVLRLVVGSELREELIRVGYERLKVILLVTEDSGMEVGVLDVLQDLHERGEGFRIVGDDEIVDHKQRVCVVYSDAATLLFSNVLKVYNSSAKLTYATIVLGTKRLLARKTEQTLRLINSDINIIIIACFDTLSVLDIVVLVLIDSGKTSETVYQKLNIFSKLLTDSCKRTMSTLVYSAIGVHKTLKNGPSCVNRSKLVEIGDSLIESVATIKL